MRALERAIFHQAVFSRRIIGMSKLQTYSEPAEGEASGAERGDKRGVRADAEHDRRDGTNESVSTDTRPKTESSTSVAKQLALLAIPTFGQLIAEPAFILVDTAIIGNVGDSALAGLSLGSTVVLTAVGLCVFLAYSTTSQVARLFGAGKRHKGMQVGLDSIWLSLFIGIVLAAALFTLADPICRFLGGREDVLEQAVIYTRAVVLGVPGMLIVYATNGIFRGLQKVNITLVAAVSGAILNTVLDVLFVIVMGFGIAGSGVATLISQWFMGIFLVVPAIRWALADGATLKPHFSGIAAAGSDGAPLFLRTLALRGAIVATVMAAAAMGTQVLAGYQIVNALWSFSVNILDSVAIAGQALVGAKIGASCFGEARNLTRITARAGAFMGVLVGTAFIVLGFIAAPAFSPNPNIQAVVAGGMLISGITMPMQGWMWALDGILIGAGDFRYLAITLFAAAAVYIGALVLVMTLIIPLIEGGFMQAVALWATFDIILMGGRALANGLRIRSDVWMKG